MVGVAFNLALLRNVKRQGKNYLDIKESIQD